MTVNPQAGEVGILIIVKNKRIERVEPAQGTEGKVRRLQTKDKEALFSKYRGTEYGLRPVLSAEEVKLSSMSTTLRGPTRASCI
jgi:hypothetical protein